MPSTWPCSNRGVVIALLGQDVYGLVHRRGKTELNISTRQENQELRLVAWGIPAAPAPGMAILSRARLPASSRLTAMCKLVFGAAVRLRPMT
jgi:hypothetical protein